MADLERVAVTPAAGDLLRQLRARHGELMFHQSGGCCDGSSPMCYPDGDFILGDADVRLGTLRIGGEGEGDAAEVGREPRLDSGSQPHPTAGIESFEVPVWMSASQFEAWKHTHLTIDVVDGRGAGFSLEAPEGKRFIIRSRLLDEPERG